MRACIHFIPFTTQTCSACKVNNAWATIKCSECLAAHPDDRLVRAVAMQTHNCPKLAWRKTVVLNRPFGHKTYFSGHAITCSSHWPLCQRTQCALTQVAPDQAPFPKSPVAKDFVARHNGLAKWKAAKVVRACMWLITMRKCVIVLNSHIHTTILYT